MINAASLRTKTTGAGFEPEIETPRSKRLDPVRCVVWGLMGLYLIPVALAVGVVAVIGAVICGLCALIGRLQAFWRSEGSARRLVGWRWDRAESGSQPHHPDIPSHSRSPWA